MLDRCRRFADSQRSEQICELPLSSVHIVGDKVGIGRMKVVLKSVFELFDSFFNSSQAAKAQAAKGGRRSVRGAAEKQAEKRAAAAEASVTKRVEVGEAVVF